jgi:hypothetical protein
MRTIWQDADRRELRERLERMSPDARPRWGRFTAPQMMAHLADNCRMMLGELSVADKNLLLRHWPIKQLVIYVLPFPKGAPTAPELLGGPTGDWAAERSRAIALLDRVAADRSRACPPHPAFGRLSRRAWGVLAYRHIDHHLRQFGV